MISFLVIFLIYSCTFICCNGKLDNSKKTIGFVLLFILTLLVLLFS